MEISCIKSVHIIRKRNFIKHQPILTMMLLGEFSGKTFGNINFSFSSKGISENLTQLLVLGHVKLDLLILLHATNFYGLQMC